MGNKPCVAIDLDGTLAKYNGWQGESVIGPPIPGAVDVLATLHQRGVEVWIFTARATRPLGKMAVEEWVKLHGLEHYIAGVTCEKRYDFLQFIDDRAIHFDGDWKTTLRALEERVAF